MGPAAGGGPGSGAVQRRLGIAARIGVLEDACVLTRGNSK
jgi:hypothetical protein